MNTYKDAWKEHLQEHKLGLLEVLDEFPVFEDWEIDHHPDMGCRTELRFALEILLAEPCSDLGISFLERAVAVAERTIAEDKLRSELCNSFFPINEAKLFWAYVYAKYLLGHPMDLEKLETAASDILAW